MITRFTTPPLSLLVKGVDITQADVYVTIKQGEVEINLTTPEITLEKVGSDTKITFSLTQAQAGSLDFLQYADFQVNWIEDGVRLATMIAKDTVYNNLYDEVIQ